MIVAQNLISARYVQLAPAYESGPTMNDGAVIPLDRTAMPVEWDEVKEQLMRLATELGPDKGMSTGSVGRFIDSAANALDGNGDKLRQTLAQLSGVGRILADGSGEHRRHDHQPADLRHRAARQQRPDRAVPGPVRDVDKRGRRQQVGPRLRAEELVRRRRRDAAFHRRHARQDRRADSAARQRHPEPGRSPHGPRKRPAHRAALDCQRRQHVRPAHRCRQRCVRAQQPGEPGVGDLRHDGRARRT